MPSELSKHEFFMLTFTAVLVAGAVLLMTLCAFGHADFFMTGSTKGDGYTYSALDGKNNYAMTQLNGTGIEQKFALDEKKTDTNDVILTVKSTVYIEDARGKGQRYVFRGSGEDAEEGVGGEIYSSDFSGRFVAQSESNFTVYEDGTVFVDVQLAAYGNQTYRGRLVRTEDGKPVAEEAFAGEGLQEIIRRVQMKTIKNYNDWLGFCNQFSDAIPESVGVKLIPENSTA